MKLSDKRWLAIQEAQRREIEQLSRDPDFAARMSRKSYFSRIGSWITPDYHRVLELGCGPGRYVAMLSSVGHQVVGVDPCSYPDWAVFRSPNVDCRSEVYAEDLPFEDKAFDAVACMGALLYFKDPGKALSEVRRVLKPGGRIVVRTVNRNNLYTRSTGLPLDAQAPNLYSRDELVRLLSDGGFNVIDTFTYGFYPPAAHGTWWYLSNVVLPIDIQKILSDLTPVDRRVTINAFAERA